MESAAEQGFTEALAFLRQKDEQDARLQAAIEAGKADAELRRKEALLRLSILEQKGLGPEAKEGFEEAGLPGISFDDAYGVNSFTPDSAADYEEIRECIKEFENRDATVYYIQHSLTFSGTMVSLFFVSNHPSEWKADREDLLKERPIVAVANLRDDYIEVGSIRFLIQKNGMERLQ
ncbi:MAG: hypothetical protein J6B85_06280 [Lachnospiraceae bacterium]|nr:hypothetical protein [Lachnospiraceae bacterium]